jgi:hypothetical protein
MVSNEITLAGENGVEDGAEIGDDFAADDLPPFDPGFFMPKFFTEADIVFFFAMLLPIVITL